ncbi:RNA polymerase II Elongator subunit [Xylariaceae sp. FL0804]|nr:RNA polymerase II Elongator subunit [Xylariaceae sp. FL0804]
MDDDGLLVEYLSAGANRHTAVADWCENGLVAFGADSNIALWRPHGATPRGISRLLSGHGGVVKAVKFLSPSCLLSGADDHCLKVWALADDDSASCVQTIQEHTAPINCIATVYQRGASDPSSSSLFATGGADATIRIWSFDGREAGVLQTIRPAPKFFPLALALSTVGPSAGGGESLVLAAAGTRDTIQLFAAESAAQPEEFRLQATLSGHEGWVRSLDFTSEGRGDAAAAAAASDLLLASASQDKYVRLWRLHEGRELPAAAAAEGADPSTGAYLPGKSPSNKAYRLRVAERDYSVTFEALLLGHDDWIYSAKWYQGGGSGKPKPKKPQLLSTSADNTLAVWEADPASGIWLTTARLGEISREKGATTATGSTGGFWTGLWSPDGASVTCLGRTGSWRLWDYEPARDRWTPAVGISGHTRAVTGVCWSRGDGGRYLLSTSADQTTRLHARWSRSRGAGGTGTWHEMARPQIHGYDLNCIDSLGGSRFVSGADEKLMRVFDEPKAVARLLHRLCDDDDDDGSNGDGDGDGTDRHHRKKIDAMPDAANMPVLGLSNKAIEAADDDAEINDTSAAAAPDPMTDSRPPLEDSLSRHTLWPEAEKLYGHGYELSCLAASHDGLLVASACRASAPGHAVVRLFETRRWTEVRPPLRAHALTVARLRFGPPPTDRMLLSVGRDRQWAVFERVADDDRDGGDGKDDDGKDDDGDDDRSGRYSYKLLQANPKGHSRMILDAAWAPATAGAAVFATAGRDKQVKIWRREEPAAGTAAAAAAAGMFVCVTTLAETHPVTAVDFLPQQRGVDDDPAAPFLLAVGTEAGKITIHSLDRSTCAVLSSLPLRPELCLAKAVLQLAWRPSATSRELAVAGEDGSLRVYALAAGR